MRKITVAMLIAILIVISGCIKEPSGQEIVQKIILGKKNIVSYGFDTNTAFTVKVNTTEESSEFHREETGIFTLHAEGFLDVMNNESVANATYNMYNDAGKPPMRFVRYVRNDTVYATYGHGWFRDSYFAPRMSYLDTIYETLERTNETEISLNETEGHYIITMKLDTAANEDVYAYNVFFNILFLPTAGVYPWYIENLSAAFVQVSVDRQTFRIDEYRVYAYGVYYNQTIGRESVEYVATGRIYDYNKSIQIDVPPEAEDAEWFPAGVISVIL
ncbi:MAG: hypothetical protein HYY37_02050 [Candidatus Aenigmarchaeota archaeon]|nr:hypothetical protein [Candidatus Aenigmarchaeota archaeon]